MNEICRKPRNHKRFVMLKTQVSLTEYSLSTWEEEYVTFTREKGKQISVPRQGLVLLGLNK